MKVIIAGTMDLEDPGQVKEMLVSAKPHIDGALEEEGCIAYDWTEDHLIPGRVHVFNQYVVRARRRDDLRAHLKERGIGTAVYYPLPLHRQECFRSLGQAERSLPVSDKACEEVLALPVYPELSEVQQEEVVQAIAEFYGVA